MNKLGVESEPFRYKVRDAYPSSSPLIHMHAHPKQQHASESKINPVILLLIIVLSAVFIISSLLHLLVRFLIKHSRSSMPEPGAARNPESSGNEAFQRQLQQLFYLHDSGLDQVAIDALPLFFYKDIVGLNQQYDCAVCLCEFSENDKLRLLPLCSHAFHMNCIDTWLLSNSTCPLCRSVLLNTVLPYENPMYDLGEIREDEGDVTNGDTLAPVVGHLPVEGDVATSSISKRVYSVRLGKLKTAESEARGESSGFGGRKVDARRCFSMGSYRYVVSELDLQVALSPEKGVHGGSMKWMLKGNVNVQDGDSELKGKVNVQDGDSELKKINGRGQGESLSISKIWQWSKKPKSPYSSVARIPI